MFRRAIVRRPAENFADGQTTVDLGVPDFEKTLAQHGRYCDALLSCGLALTRLAADPRHPDSTFVEDTALIAPGGAILTRPGAPSREGEIADMEPALHEFFPALRRIQPPGTVDGGGASTVDIRSVEGILHLKSGIAWLSGRRLVVIEELASHPAFAGWEIVGVDPGEEYAANCVPVNERVLFAKGFPRLEKRLSGLGYRPLVLDVSEYRKMDGGLSCLSLRFG